jgi:methionyl-tRNA formyltransferase
MAMSGKQLRIVFMGTPEFAVHSLRALVEGGYNVVAVVTTPDKPAGRGQKMHQSDVKVYAESVGLRVLQPVRLKDEAFVEEFRALNADLGVVIAFRMLPEVIWSMPRLGTFNLHASLLPQYRGAAPINWAIINGDKVSGITTFMLKHEIDTGDVIEQVKVDITPEDNAGSLHDKLMMVGKDAVLATIEKIAEGRYAAIPQDEMTTEELRGAPKIFKEDCRIDWSKSGDEIALLVRGLSPYPAAWSSLYTLSGEECGSMKIFEAEFVAGASGEPGTIFTDWKKELEVACADGRIAIKELQLAGKRRMATEDFLRGMRDIDCYKMSL